MPAKKDTTVATVIMRTTRDDTGIDYEVLVETREDAHEQGDNQYGVWSARVDFGQTDAYVAGGHAFVAAARTQEAIADEVFAMRNGRPWLPDDRLHWANLTIWDRSFIPREQ